MTTDSGERQWQIEELLHRRTDLSTFVIHWTRDYAGTNAKDNLRNILMSRTLEARTARGVGQHALRKLCEAEQLSEADYNSALASQHVVCFSEAPLEQAWSFVCTIIGRECELRPFGLAFRKQRARLMGINPVWYTDATPAAGRSDEWLSNEVGHLVARATRQEGGLLADPIARIAPFVEVMGTWEGRQKEFWWEREWRHLGNLTFSLADVAVVLCHEQDMADFEPFTLSESGRTVPLLDPQWGLERMIAHLAGASDTEL
jgi:hypothetical protein